MSRPVGPIRRRQFLKTTVKASTLFAVPQIIPGCALGKNGTVAPMRELSWEGSA